MNSVSASALLSTTGSFLHQGPAGGAVLVARGNGCLSQEKAVRVSVFRDLTSAVGILARMYLD